MRRKKERDKIKAREGALPSPSLLFIAIFTSHRSPLSERLEQAKAFRQWFHKNFWQIVSIGVKTPSNTNLAAFRDVTCKKEKIPLPVDVRGSKSLQTSLFAHFPATFSSYGQITFSKSPSQKKICLKNGHFEEKIHLMPLIISVKNVLVKALVSDCP